MKRVVQLTAHGIGDRGVVGAVDKEHRLVCLQQVGPHVRLRQVEAAHHPVHGAEQGTGGGVSAALVE